MSNNALANSKRGAKGPTHLARGLLFAVFTDGALVECNATGYGNSYERKKMLNQKGMQAIYKYVKKESLKNKKWCPNGWTDKLDQQVRRSVTKKLNEMKKEHELNLKQKKYQEM